MESIPEIVSFLKTTFKTQGNSTGVIAVSGGIDSAVSLSLLTTALGSRAVYPLFLPYGDQSIEDSQLIAKWNNIPEKNWGKIDIKPAVDLLFDTLCHSRGGSDSAPASGIQGAKHKHWIPAFARMTDMRKGNIMARVRMICVFDRAKELNALVCGTENKSEHYLGYFTRFGDAASDIEPISGLYKTQVRQIAKQLGIPQVFLDKAPSAGLWEDQTDENEMGFTYEEADQALAVLLEESKQSIDPILIAKVKKLMDSQAFKLHVPYILNT